jgi:N-acyl-L-homoserine lactone synthetase
MSLYTHAGVSTHNGVTKVRFANDALRVKVLAKNGHKGIDIVELKNPMTKEDAVAYLLSINFDNGNQVVRAALEAAADKRGVDIPSAPAQAPAKAKKVSAKELDEQPF